MFQTSLVLYYIHGAVDDVFFLADSMSFERRDGLARWKKMQTDVDRSRSDSAQIEMVVLI
jgi:hypothetical protein